MASVDELGNTQMKGWLRLVTFNNATDEANWGTVAPDGVMCYRSDLKALRIKINGAFGSVLTDAAFEASPTINSITPAGGTPLGGDAVTIDGSNFFPGCTVTIDGVPATSIAIVDENTITCVTPAGSAGAVDVVVARTGFTSATLAAGFTYAAGPAFTSITPNHGQGGLAAVTIVGTGFVPGTTVTVGGVALASLVIVDSAHITGTVAAHAAGAVDVVINNINGTDTGTGAFTYEAPTFTSITPANGGASGGDAVTIMGTGFIAGTTVTVGGVALASLVIVDSTHITGVTPAGTVGARDVVITNADGSVTGVGAYTFTKPTFTSITPNNGVNPGGTAVTIVGTHFRAGTTVTVGGVALTSLVIVDSTHITGVTGAHAAGAVDVVVANVNGTDTGAGAFTYT